MIQAASPRSALALSFLAVALATAGCGSGDSESKSGGKKAGSGARAAAVTIRESEYKLNPANPKVAKAHVVVFRVRNQGKNTHALEIEGPGGEQRTPRIAPGSSATLRADLSKPGSYEFYCPIDDHRKLGMAGQVIVAGGGKSGTEDKGGGGKSGSGGYGY
ncbi:MAG: cupredoxin domain-containing protein [Thermoleophilaceae bacterium]